jgi:hypothetical protein
LPVARREGRDQNRDLLALHFLAKLLAGQNGNDARHGQRFRGIDAGDAGMAMLAANKTKMERARQRDIGKITAISGEEPHILTPSNGLADPAFVGFSGVAHMICLIGQGSQGFLENAAKRNILVRAG